jgi:hypothetical protein
MNRFVFSDKRFEIKASGFALYFFCFLLILFLLPLPGMISEYAQHTGSPVFSIVVGVIYLAGYSILALFTYKYWNGNRVIMTSERLIVISDFPGGRLNIRKYEEIDIEHIDHIYIGRLKKPPNRALGRSGYYLINAVAVQFSPFLDVFEKSGKEHVFSTAPFSKKGFRSLVKAIEEAGIRVDVQKNLLYKST